MNARLKLPTPCLLPALFAATLLTGCAHLAEDLASHLARQDVQAIDQEFAVVEGDLASFRTCLEDRGGSCQGNAAAPLPHSSQDRDGEPLAPADPGASRSLAESVAALPVGHPAKIAHEVLSHPLTRQAAALHDHLRGHDTGSTPGVSATRSQGAHGGPESTVTLDLQLGQIRHFHDRLLASLGTAWDALDGHCRELLAARLSAPDFDRLDADCRLVAFVRGYLGAYLRHGEIVEVDVRLAGAIRAIDRGTAKLKTDIQSVRDRLAKLEQGVGAAESEVLKGLSDDARQAANAVKSFVAEVDAASSSLGPDAAETASGLAGLLGQAENQASRLADQAEAPVAEDVRTVAADLNGILDQIDAALAQLQADVEGFDRQFVQDIDDELDKTNKALSNVFKVSNVGFLSRDATFLAKVPAFEVTLDPTAKLLLTVTDQDSGQLLTTRSDLTHLGVASDASGVGTGAAVGAELVRVFLEAIFDAREGLPAVAPANLAGVRPTGLTLGRYALPLFQSPTGHVDDRDLTNMTYRNDAVALKTRLLVGRIISGVGPLSLGNPPLESFITEIVATSVRKAVEKASWCWYACNLDVEVAKLSSAVGRAVEDKLSEEEQKLQAAIEAEQQKLAAAIAAGDQEAQAAIGAQQQKLEEAIAGVRQELQAKLEAEDRKAWAGIDRKAEHVKLRLKLRE